MARKLTLAPLLAALLLAACGEAPQRQPIPGPEARKAVDDATAAYADCVEQGAREAPAGGIPGTVIEGIVASCKAERQALAERILELHRLGHPSMTEDQSRTVAEASIQQIEPDIKSAGVAAYVEQTSQTQKAS